MTTMVRMKVARSELMFSTPTLAKIAVSAANTAENTAQTCQDDHRLMRVLLGAAGMPLLSR